jgi:hypothetical protein
MDLGPSSREPLVYPKMTLRPTPIRSSRSEKTLSNSPQRISHLDNLHVNQEGVNLVISETRIDQELAQIVQGLISLRKKLELMRERTDASSVMRSVIVGMTLNFIQKPTPEREEEIQAAFLTLLRNRETQLSNHLQEEKS